MSATNPGALEAWRQRMGWSQRQAAAELGLNLKTYQQQERGVSWKTGEPITAPRTTLLAAAALEQGLGVIPG